MTTSRFIVLVGTSDRRRSRGMVSAFADVEEARQEFSRAEERLGATATFVELASVDDEGRLSPLVRSGGHSPPAQAATRRSASTGADPRWRWT